jgi:ribose transport system substrate-binding protein
MMMKSGRIRRSLLVTVASFCLGLGLLPISGAKAADADAQANEKIRVAVLVKTLSNPYWLMLKAGAEAAAKETGANVVVTGSQSELDIQGQIDRVRSLITQHVNVIVISPNSAAQLQPVLQQAVNAGIPVILIDTDIADWHQKLSFIGTDNYQAGVVAGKFIASVAPTGSLAIIGGTPGNPATDSRVAGLKKALTGVGVHYVSELSAYSDRSRAVTATSDTLEAHPDTNVIFAPADNMALGAVQAILATGKKTSNFTVVSVDGTPEGAKSILNGGLTATVAQNPYLMGKDAVEMAVAKVHGKPVPRRIDTGAVLVTKKNATSFLATLTKELSGG